MAANSLLELLDNAISAALDMLYENDVYLFSREVHERTIVFRFGHYLQNIMDESADLKEYNLDFEYNRNGRQPKRIPGRSRNGAYPDLIVHKRGSNTYNILVMEFKTYWNPDNHDDCEKLRRFTDPDGGYHYRCGKSIVLGINRQSTRMETFLPYGETSEKPDAAATGK